MVDVQTLEKVKQRLIKAYNPLEIYLFGSYARGCPDEDSDLDLLIVIEAYDTDRYHALVKGHRALMDMDVSKDLFVFSREEFDRDADDVTTFCYKVKHKGKKIYAKA